MRMLVLIAAFVAGVVPAQAAKRVALVIGQDAYTELTKLANPRNDAHRMAGVLMQNGFEVISCDGKQPGCFDQTRAGLLGALTKLELAADQADLALIFYAGHGLETDEGNILAPIDASVDCGNWRVKRGVLVEQFILAASPAKHKVIIIDACRDNPMGHICPPPGKALSFADIKVPNAQDFLLVTSTKPGQQAQDGPPGKHSPFAHALFAALEQHSGVYFDQVFNRVAKAVVEATKTTQFTQLPEIIARGGAPEACLRGSNCGADPDGARLRQALMELKEDLRKEFASIHHESDATLLDRAMRSHTPADIGQAAALKRMIAAGSRFIGLNWNGGSFAKADISGGDFSRTTLHGVDLSQVTAVAANFESTGIRFASLREGNFTKARISNSYAPLIDARSGVFSNANMSASDFTGSDFRSADFTNADLRNAVFAFADLRGAKLDGADLTGAYLVGANLDGATFVGARVQATDFGGATSGKFDLSMPQRVGACRSPVYKNGDGETDFNLTLFERRNDVASRDGHALTQLFQEHLRIDVFGDNSLPLCPRSAMKPRTFNPEFPGSIGLYADADWARGGGVAESLRGKMKGLSLRIRDVPSGNRLHGDGSEERGWIELMEGKVRSLGSLGTAHLGADHLLPLLLAHKAIAMNDVDWVRRAEIRHWLETRIDEKVAGRFDLETQWPRFFPAGIPFKQLPSQTIELFKNWTAKRAQSTSNMLVFRPSMVDFRKLLRSNAGQELTFQLSGYGELLSSGGTLHATRTEMTAPSWFDLKDVSGRWYGLEAYENSMGLDKVMLVFEQPMEEYKVTISRDAFDGAALAEVASELDLEVYKVDATRKSRYGRVAMIYVRVKRARLRTPASVIWQGLPSTVRRE